MAVSAEKRSSRVRRQASKKQRKNRTVQVRFSDEELAALDAVCESTGMLRSDTLNGCEKGLEEVRGELSKLAREVETLRQDFGSDMFSALMYSDDPGRLSWLVNYWFGMGGDA